MEDELAITTSLDQPLLVEYDDVLEVVQDSINRAVQKGDLEEALTVCSKLINVIKVGGLVLARIFTVLHDAWPKFGISENFYDVVSSYLGVHRNTVVTYERVDMMLRHFVPPELREEIKQKSIMTLIPVANAIEQGYEINEDDWKKIANAPDYKTIGAIIRDEIKEAPPRKSSLSILMDRDGSLWAWKDNQRKFIGSLEVNDEDDAVRRAINRIVNNSGIIIE